MFGPFFLFHFYFTATFLGEIKKLIFCLREYLISYFSIINTFTVGPFNIKGWGPFPPPPTQTRQVYNLLF